MSTDRISQALVKAQETFEEIKRDKSVTVTTANRGSYTFAYAPLESILAAVQPALRANGLILTQTIEGENGARVMATRLLHGSGQELSSTVPLVIPAGASNQQIGSAITYARRYCITNLLCLSSEEDDDATSAEGNTVTSATSKPRSEFQARGKAIIENARADAPKIVPKPTNGDPIRKYQTEANALLQQFAVLASNAEILATGEAGQLKREALRLELVGKLNYKTKMDDGQWELWISGLRRLVASHTPPVMASVDPPDEGPPPPWAT